MYFGDPDGNILELIARRNLANDAPGDFDASMLLRIAEFGLPTADPASTVSELERVLGLDIYDGDRQTFTAVGSETGLFIVVPIGRKWFPTEVAAAESVARVRVVAPNEGEVQVGDLVHVTGQRDANGTAPRSHPKRSLPRATRNFTRQTNR